MKKFLKTAIAVAVAGSPMLAFAANTLNDIFIQVGRLIGILTPVIVALALMGFFWGLAMYILNFSGEDKDKKKGRDMMVYGVLVLFVMVSVWGIVQVLQSTFAVDPLTNQQAPGVRLP